jgi:hypothetical protein
MKAAQAVGEEFEPGDAHFKSMQYDDTNVVQATKACIDRNSVIKRAIGVHATYTRCKRCGDVSSQGVDCLSS